MKLLNTHSLQQKLSVAGLLVLAAGCSNSFNTVIPVPNPTFTGGTTLINTNRQTTADRNVISNISVAAPAGTATGTAQVFTTNVFFDTTQSTNPISNHCTGASAGAATAKGCICVFKWNETNPNASAAVPTLRSVQTNVASVQPNFLTCPAPDVYSSEIPDGTGIAITVVPAPSNPDTGLFSVTTFAFTKSASLSGSFKDAQGRVFDNILRYSCYQKFQKGINITSKYVDQKEPTSGSSTVLAVGTQFCVSSGTPATGSSGSTGGGGGGGGGGEGGTATACPNARADYSTQSYYFNLYLRNSERGDFNISNDSFACPIVKETLNSNGQVGTTAQPWPFDASFALSLAPTSTFTIGVEANTKLATGADPVAGNNTCFPQSSTTPSPGPGGTTQATTTAAAATPPSSTAFVHSCLGFAARVNLDGTCPTITTQGNQLLPTYRLRRFVAIYPKLFDVKGTPLSTPQSVDTIYVLDRPVVGSPDPTHPYTMLGPKPCPFAFFDRAGVTGPNVIPVQAANTPALSYTVGGRGYYGTNNVMWTQKNVDGIEFPNIDEPARTNRSCSATLPILSDDRKVMSFTTVNINNTGANALKHVYVRPAQPFAPHYEEDLSFRACAPQANPATDPPLHFARDDQGGIDTNTNNVGWCAEAYPTQNGNISALDPVNTRVINANTGTGMVAPFTSHVTKNTISSTCTGTTITGFMGASYNYPPTAGVGGVACVTAAANLNTLSSYCYASHPNAPYPYPSTNDAAATASNTCDRTVLNKDAYSRFPLLAPPPDVESAIRADSSYHCSVTYDGVNGPKTGKASPSDGCCNANRVLVPTGTASTANNGTAHLGPDIPCGSPRY